MAILKTPERAFDTEGNGAAHARASNRFTHRPRSFLAEVTRMRSNGKRGQPFFAADEAGEFR